LDAFAALDDEDEERFGSDADGPSCEYDGGEIVLSHPMSIGKDDTHYVLGSQMLAAAHMTLDQINLWPRCGVTIQDKNYSLTLQTYGDQSDQNKTARIGRAIVNDNVTDFLLAGYSSSLTAFLTPIANDAERICLTGGSSRTSVHANYSYVFGLNPPSDAYLEYAFRGTHEAGALTVAYLAEEGADACTSVPDMAAKYNMTVVNGTDLPEDAPLELYEQVAHDFKTLYQPDVVITCVRTQISLWNQAMRAVNWSPKAQVYTYVIGTPEFEDVMGDDLPFVMGVSSWDRALPPIPDGATQWTPHDFDVEFERAAFRRPAYQHVQMSACISVLVQALERINSPDFRGDDRMVVTDQIQQALATEFFPTVYGNISFDANGQNAAPFLLLQYDANATLRVLLPEAQRFIPNITMVYPLPSWEHRDCLIQSTCTKTNGTCTDDGTCACIDPTFVSEGMGPNATCIAPLPVAPRNKALVIAFPVVVALLLVAGLAFYIHHQRVKTKNDAVWRVSLKELQFADPPEIIGRGTYGLVLLGNFRGTQVAIKRVLPPPENNSSKRNQHRKSTFDIDHDIADNLEEEGRASRNSSDGMVSGMVSTRLSSGSFGSTTFTTTGIKRTSSGGGGRGAASMKRINQEFRREMRLLSKLRHPCVTTVMGTFF